MSVVVRNREDVLKADERAGLHAFIQYKGSNICTDVGCACGALLHYDGDFAYVLECPHCERLLALSPYVKVFELPADSEERRYAKRAEPDEDVEAKA